VGRPDELPLLRSFKHRRDDNRNGFAKKRAPAVCLAPTRIAVRFPSIKCF
jgi:hypothetical protein